ncbi:MAG: heme-binding protein, partial [Cyclobacteriaceae bacterium]|nr:heme-binding protein [Cyclobacteriaceae bacterium]
MGRSIISLTVCLVFFLASCKKSENLSPQLNIVDGFEVEKILESSDSTFGSWVSITSDNKGRLLVSDQYGKVFRFYPPLDDETINMDNIESIDLEIGYAQGLLWTEDGLFVTVNQERSEKNPGSGLYKLIDSNNDDNYDKMILIQSLKGGGEHGPHSLLKGPDGYIYLIAGNGTLLPDSIGYQMPDIYENDNILPIITDPHGIFSGWKPPGGWIVRMDKNGENWELWAGGFRNSYDIAFDENGELFTFDSDMEWDLGTPWYRPVRICHVIKGAEFGWRTGSGKWPPYYPDNLPGILDIGQ